MDFTGKKNTVLTNENGSALVFAIMILVLLTLISIFTSNSSTNEVRISTNQRFNQMAFFAAESGWQVAVNRLDLAFPPVTTDSGLDMSSGQVALSSSKYSNPDSFAFGSTTGYSVTAQFEGTAYAPGYSTDFKQYIYGITSTGTGPANSQCQVTIRSRKIVYVGGY